DRTRPSSARTGIDTGRAPPPPCRRWREMTRRDKPGLPEEFGRPEWDSSQRHQSAVAEYVAYLSEKKVADDRPSPHEPDLASFTDEEVMYIINQASRQVDEPFDPGDRDAEADVVPGRPLPRASSAGDVRAVPPLLGCRGRGLAWNEAGSQRH